MFLDPANNWGGLDPEYLLALRAVAPAGVFTEKAMENYLSAVRGDDELCLLAPALFGSDADIIEKLPVTECSMKSELIKLMELAYKHRIRLA